VCLLAWALLQVGFSWLLKAILTLDDVPTFLPPALRYSFGLATLLVVASWIYHDTRAGMREPRESDEPG
jgi:hypothetical protein